MAPSRIAAEAHADVVVVGAGIAGLTAASLLAREGLQVELLEAHHQSGGCAGTFRRGAYTFDVGATQVAGLEPGGIHDRLFRQLGVEPPAATPLDPGCLVDLADGSTPVALWRDPERWASERQRQFPGSERFWSLCQAIHQANWGFAGREPVLPPRNLWDLGQLLGALRPANLASGLLTGASVADLLWLSGCAADPRLRRFLDLQLRLYSQEPAERTAALYGASVLAMAQEPLGLWHLEGSMQGLSSALEQALSAAGGRLWLRHRVTGLGPAPGGGWQLEGEGPGGQPFQLHGRELICTAPPQALPALLGEALPPGYRRRLEGFGDPSGALVLYAAVERSALPGDCPAHLQLDWADPGSLFVSVSREGDGRAPAGEATVIASVFTAARPWFEGDASSYLARKQKALAGLQAGLSQLLGLTTAHYRHAELSTPRSFERWTSRPFGFVGGLGQQPSRFGPFGLASRTPLPGFWLCGDAIYPGEGTAGVSLSAQMVCRQLLAGRGREPSPP
ncbi:C-3',4' desaturase CrtD [Synechococcus sp. CS-1324]|uniref:C-3',4' desaturase CrtD n=1 Tax=Synechococcus sp. CS-1324 TaxID=2847980 RepID=UPI000DAF7DD3|nr:C-3',4' desaturase CrtD [Synechococcus sp. CS-1324]MCT0229319.1 C-3',4' desaturase CrtD [Synechococcus sp. CS-1324]PZV06227.1 MAG: C-3',4' desaturase CrtD [Cyanobium sp.]